MKTAKQFWNLLKFQLSINPFILLYPLLLGIPSCFEYVMGWQLRDDHHLSPSTLTVPMVIGIMWLVPTFLSNTPNGEIFNSLSGAESILTRAVDRHLLYRARACLFYSLILLFPLAMFFAHRGSFLAECWQLWIYLFAVMGIPILIFLSHPIKHSLIKLFALITPIIIFQRVCLQETLFGYFFTHQLLFWIPVALAFIPAQLWCERRFARLEQ